MILTPVSKEYLRGLKQLEEEKNRKDMMDTFIKNIYDKVLQKAKKTTISLFRYDVTYVPDCIRNNMDIIMEKLEKLFPDCSVHYGEGTILKQIIIDWS